jgi:NAD(P)-dependent dehydrogenase (short-subunit alcohol dehydrogenase family)
MRFKDQVALVTGAGRGIGKAIALALAREGADIGLAEIDEQTAQATADEIRAMGRRAFFKLADIGDCAQAQGWVAEAARELGRVDIMINNAGVAKGQPFLEISPENWENHLRVHLFGTFYCSQAAARAMAPRKYGRIVSMASVAGLMGPLDLAPYGAAKAGIIGLTRAMALELADYGITANAIAPGPIDTEMVRAAWSREAYEERANHSPINRFGSVDEVARLATFLASPESSYISGAVMVIDGGATAAGSYMVEKYRRRKAAARK